MWGEAERKLGNNGTMGEWEPLKLLIETVIILVIRKFFSSILSFGISATRLFFFWPYGNEEKGGSNGVNGRTACQRSWGNGIGEGIYRGWVIKPS